MKSKQKDNYSAWEINEKDFPTKGTIEDKIRFLIGYGILAPSTHNTQPWSFEILKNQLIIKPNEAKKLRIGDPDSLGLFISIGACIENIQQASSRFGLNAQADLEKNSFIIKFNPGIKSKNSKVLENIKNRHSHKLPHDSHPISKSIILKLEKLSDKNTKVHIFTSKKEFNKLANLHLNSAKVIANNHDFAFELVDWLRTNKTREYDGMPGFVVGNSQLKSFIGKILLKKKPELLGKMAEKDKDLINSSSAIVVFSVALINPKIPNMITAGQLIERFWLKATELGLVVHPLFASIQHKPATNEISNIIGGKTPVFFMRMGYSKNKHFHTPRKQHKWNY